MSRKQTTLPGHPQFARRGASGVSALTLPRVMCPVLILQSWEARGGRSATGTEPVQHLGGLLQGMGDPTDLGHVPEELTHQG